MYRCDTAIFFYEDVVESILDVIFSCYALTFIDSCLSRLQNFSNFLIGLPLTAHRRIALLFGFQGNWISCQVSRCSNVFATKAKFLSINKQLFHKRL